MSVVVLLLGRFWGEGESYKRKRGGMERGGGCKLTDTFRLVVVWQIVTVVDADVIVALDGDDDMLVGALVQRQEMQGRQTSPTEVGEWPGPIRDRTGCARLSLLPA